MTAPSQMDPDRERWLAETFRPSAMVWLLRHILEGPHNQAQLVQAGREVGYSVAAVRHAIEVGRRTGILRVEKPATGGRSYAITATDLGIRLAETPMMEWETAGMRGYFRDVPFKPR